LPDTLSASLGEAPKIDLLEDLQFLVVCLEGVNKPFNECAPP